MVFSFQTPTYNFPVRAFLAYNSANKYVGINNLFEHKLDLSAFHAQYKNDKTGRKAYHPATLLRIIFYAYYRGITSSRVIASCCKTDIVFISLAAGYAPHYTKIADFVSGRPAEIKELFLKVLLVCEESGLIGKNLIAVDGCKLSSNAAKTWSGTFDELTKKATKLKDLIAYYVEKHLVEDAQGVFDENRREQERQTQPKPSQSKRRKEVMSNITDNDSAKMKTSKGVIQGHNAITAADSLHQIIVGAQTIGVGPEQSTLIPLVEQIQSNFKELGISEHIFETARLVADTGSSSEANMKYLFDTKIDAYISDNQFRKRDLRFMDSSTYQQHQTERNNTRQDGVEGKTIFGAEEFICDFTSQSCRCPAGKELRLKKVGQKRRNGIYMTFVGKLSDCRECSLQANCMRKAVGDRGRQESFLVEEVATESCFKRVTS